MKARTKQKNLQLNQQQLFVGTEGNRLQVTASI